jgi:hypothetical protein
MCRSLRQFDRENRIFYFVTEPITEKESLSFAELGIEILDVMDFLGKSLVLQLKSERSLLEFMWTLPSVVLSRILPLTRGATNGRIALVRHYTHLQAPVKLPENCDELSVQLSHPNEIVTFIETLIKYESVVTSAMHVLITCQSYGIPCALVVFNGFEEYVHGDGIKYIDYALGADVKPISPTPINPKLDWRRQSKHCRIRRLCKHLCEASQL